MKYRAIAASLLSFFLIACDTEESSVTATPESDTTDASADNTVAVALAEQAPQGKLPVLARPLHYELSMQIDPRKEHFKGELKLDIALLKAASGVWLHGQHLNIKQITLHSAAGSDDVSYQEVLPSGVAYVDFGQQRQVGNYTLNIQYSAAFDTNLAGLFKVEEQGDFYALAKSESIQARKYLPGFDEPGYKAPFDITLTIPKEAQAISNTPELTRQSVDEQYDSVTFATTPAMPTYLLSLAVGPFDVVERPDIPASRYRNTPVPLRGFARRGKGEELAYVLDITPRFVEIFEEDLQQPYPFKKLDIVAAPQWPSGATELSGAITYREERLFLDDNAGPGARLSLLGIHAHELAHMWFGNLVTPPWWDDLWLKEGFATWATPVVLNQFEPDGGHLLNGQVRNFGVMKVDSLASTRAIREPILLNDNIRNAYDGITYSKSQAVIHMLDQYFGEQIFRPALGKYVAAFANDTADSADFYARIAAEMGNDELQSILQNFVEQQGVPLLEVGLHCDSPASQIQTPAIEIRQQRYAPLGSTIDTGYRWTIPVCVKTGITGSDATRMHCDTISTEHARIELGDTECPDWIMPNANGNGYYRWQLADTGTWQMLLKQFSTLNPAEQLAIVDSSTAAFEAGKLSLAELLDVVKISIESDKRQVVLASRSAIQSYLQQALSDQQIEQVRDQLIQPLTDRLSLIDSLENPEALLLHLQLRDWLASDMMEQSNRKQLADQAVEYLHSGGTDGNLPSDLFSSAFSIAIQEHGQSVFDQLVSNLAQIDDPRFAATAPIGLGSFIAPELSQSAYQLVLSKDSPLGARERFDMLTRMLSIPELRNQHWQWVQQHLPEILKVIPEQWRRRAPRLATAFCDVERLNELEALFSRYAELAPGSELALAQTEETIRLCIALRDKHYQ